MYKLTQINTKFSLLASVLLITVLSACNGAEMTSDAPGATDSDGQVTTQGQLRER
jgi:hypothetical protein